MLKPGEVVDRYEVEERIGEGGMATVYRVRHTLLGSLHALKVLRGDLVRDDDLRQRFLAEGRIQAQLYHPYIAAVTDLVSASGVAGLVMEYLEGGTLADRLDAGGPLPPDEALDVFGPVLLAMEHAHAMGVVHRDLKPSNLYLSSRARGMVRPVVLDFGIAKVERDAAVTAFRSKETAVGARMGTVHYMSPEQVRSAAEVGPRSDVFSLGVILYEALTGHVAFDGEGDFEVMQRIAEGRGPDVAAALPAACGGLADVVARAMAHEAEARFDGCAAFRVALEDAVRGPRQRLPTAGRDPAPAPADPAPAKQTGLALLVKMPGTAYQEVFTLQDDVVILDELRGQVRSGERELRHTHARLTHDPLGWKIELVGTGRSLKVDGEVVRAPRRLVGGETVELGTHVFRLILR